MPEFLALFQEVHFWSIKRVYFFKKANGLNFNFDMGKKGPSCSNLGQGGRGLGDSGNARKKTFFSLLMSSLNGSFKLLSSAVLCGWWVGGKMPANISRWRKVMSSSRSRPLIIASWIVFVWYAFFFYNQYSMFDIFHLFCLPFVKLWDLYDHTMQGGFDPSSMCRSLGGWELELPPQWQSGVSEGLRGTIGGFCCPNPKNHLFLGLPPQRAP